MLYHSQNNEAEIVLNYFNGRAGVFCDIGSNDGITFSNSYDLVKSGWQGCCLEPSPQAFERLYALHYYNRVNLYNYGISNQDSKIKFHESGSLLKAADVGLVSCINASEKERWTNVDFEEIEVEMKTFASFLSECSYKKFHFISIDAEGEDYNILKQIDLAKVGCKCLCIEWNSNPVLAALFTAYCEKYGLKEINRNAENIIFAL